MCDDEWEKKSENKFSRFAGTQSVVRAGLQSLVIILFIILFLALRRTRQPFSIWFASNFALSEFRMFTSELAEFRGFRSDACVYPIVADVAWRMPQPTTLYPLFWSESRVVSRTFPYGIFTLYSFARRNKSRVIANYVSFASFFLVARCSRHRRTDQYQQFCCVRVLGVRASHTSKAI